MALVKPSESRHNKRFKCPDCAGWFATVTNSRNRTGTARMRTYECNVCKGKLTTVEVPVEEDLRAGPTAESVLRREILEKATARELLDALRWKVQD